VLAHVPDAPGLYAVYGSREAWAELQLECESDQRSLNVGKAEDSLVSRDLKTHFATGRTGSSTVRRSFAALLRDSLDLRGQPRVLAKPKRFANFSLAQPDDQRLTDWMHRHLRLAVWIKPPGAELDRIETDVIRAWQPPLNWRQFVAVFGEVIVGYANVRQLPGWKRHVGDIALVVRADYRRTGIGTALAKAVIETGRELSLRKLIVEVVEEQHYGQHIFVRLGFRCKGLLADDAIDYLGRLRNLMLLSYELPT
jgi:GNAT superfamily N-acetyltransferase